MKKVDTSKFIVLLVGPSGSGKTSTATILKNSYGWKELNSYTTREPRYPGELGHEFITEEMFQTAFKEYGKDDPMIAAYTDYNGHRYFSTQKQVEESNLYTVDPNGIDAFKNRYHGNKKVIIIYFDISKEGQKKRMMHRGDADQKIEERLICDSEVFTDEAKSQADLVIQTENYTKKRVAQLIYEFVLDQLVC